jgi:hypothetical protein
VLAGWTNSAVGSAAYTFIAVTSVGKGATTSSSTLTYSAIVAAGTIVVNVYVPSLTFVTSVTFNGSALTSVGTTAVAGGNTLYQYYGAVSAVTGNVVVTVSGPTKITSNAVNITGLTHNAPDVITTSSQTSGTPACGPTPHSSVANEAVVAAFGMQTISAPSITWGSGFTTGAQDQSITATHVYTLTEASKLASSIAAFSSSVSGTTPTNCAGFIVSYY